MDINSLAILALTPDDDGDGDGDGDGDDDYVDDDDSSFVDRSIRPIKINF